jgi:hypothetical protein
MSIQAARPKQAQQSEVRIGNQSNIIPNIIRNINKIAVFVFSLYVLSNIPQVSSGPLSYAACCIGCTTVAPPLFPACVTICLALLPLPTP